METQKGEVLGKKSGDDPLLAVMELAASLPFPLSGFTIFLWN
jgi:hypothetical protein